MQNSEEELRFFKWPQLQQPPPSPPSQSALSTGMDTSSVPARRSASLSQPLPPAAIAMPLTTEGMGRYNDASRLPLIFNRSKLKDKPPILSAHRSHHEDATEVLRSILRDIEDGLTPDSSAVDLLIVHHRGQFACPFAGCLKDGGWDCPRNAREHLWINHLFRKFPCTWEGWYVSRPTDQFAG
jgi:hypothetical protein